MPYADWLKRWDGSQINWSADIHIRLTTTGSPAPIVGTKCLEMYGKGNHWHDPPQHFVLSARCTLSSALNLQRGKVRTLLRVAKASGPATGRLRVGIFSMLGTGSRIHRQGDGRVLWLCDGDMTLGTWSNALLCTSGATSTSTGNDWDLRYDEYLAFTVLESAPLPVAKTSVVALELEWYVPRSDDFTGMHLIGRLGSALDYSDLTQVVEYTSVNLPDFINPAANSVQHLGVVTMYDSYNGQLADVHTLFDQTAWDQINAVPNVTGRRVRAYVPYKERKVPPVAPDEAPVAPLTT